MGDLLQDAVMSTGERWRLGHRPALDGLRGIAVLLVVAAHAVPTWFPGAGAVGVTIFFVLSGFLITSLLLDEHADEGRVGLRSFYLRRGARLFPALVVFVVVVIVLQVAVAKNFGRPTDAIWVALYIGNWLPALGSPMGGLDHTWSLAVEEQFYLLFPAALVFLLRRRHAAVAIALLTLASASTRVGLLAEGASIDRVYNGTDTVACLLLAGCCTAFIVRTRATRPKPWLAYSVLGVLAVCGLAFTESNGARSLLPLAVAPASAVALVALLDVRSGPIVASWLMKVGKRSYGLYLWHFPLLMVIGEALDLGGGVPRWASAPFLIAAAWGLTCLSWRCVEQPAQQWLRSRLRDTEPVAQQDAVGLHGATVGVDRKANSVGL